MNHFRLRAILLITLGFSFFAGKAFSQGTYIDVRALNGGFAAFEADSHFLGESFIYTDPNRPIVVWLKGNKAGWTGRLSFVMKRANGTTYTLPMMTNKDPNGTTYNVSALVAAAGETISVGDEIYFMYVNESGPSQAVDFEPKYTGENLPDDDFITGPTNARFGGHAFSAAGRVNADSVEFSFEDQANTGSDFDFSDIVFGVSGLTLVRELRPPEVIFNPQSTTFQLTQAVSLTGVANTNIFYRLNDAGPWLLYSGILTVDKTTKISAHQVSLFGTQLSSDTTSEVYTHQPLPSVLKITKVNGEDLNQPGKFLTELDNQFNIELTVYYAPSIMNSVALAVVSGSDAEGLTLTNPAILNNAAVFRTTVNLNVGATGTPNDGTLATKYYDLVAVSWTNPQNASEILSGSFKIQPSEKPAVLVYVTDATASVPLTGDIAVGTTVLYVLLEDQVIDSTKLDQYKVTFINVPGVANANTPDSVQVGITELSPGRYVAIVPMATGGPNLNDNTLQAIVGDQIQAVYVDPNYNTDKAVIQKGFGVPTQKAGRVFFVDKLGNEILRSDTTFWDLNEDSVYVRYIDDDGNGWTKELIMYVSNSVAGNSYGIDTGVFVMEFKGDSVWETGVPIQDAKVMNLNNNILDIYFHGLLVAKVFTHRNNIAAENKDNGFVTATMHASYPGDTTIIVIRDPVRDSINRESNIIEVCVTDQVYSKVEVDTIVLDEIGCAGSLDKEEGIKLIQTSVTSNKYCALINKNEGPIGVSGDNILTCNIEDVIHVEYENPVTEEITEEDAFWNYGVITRLEILSTDTLPLVSAVNEIAGGNGFLVRLTGYDSSISQTNETRIVNIKMVSSVAGTDDIIPVVVTEVGRDASGAAIFVGSFTAEMVTNLPLKNDLALQSLISTDSLYNLAGIQAFYDDPNDLEPERVSLPAMMVSAFIKSEHAIILDNDGDGKPDQIKIIYAQMEFQKPSMIPSIVWPTDQDAQSILDPNAILISAPSDTVTINLTGNPAFDIIDTDLDPGATLTLPGDIYFRGVNLPILDKISPVVVSGNVDQGNEIKTIHLPDGEDSLYFAPDTLTVTLSEKIYKNSNAIGDVWNRLYCYEKVCGDNLCIDISFVDEPSVVNEVDSLVWQGTIERSGITAESCLRMKSDAEYVDISNNDPGEKSIQPTVDIAKLSFTDAEVMYPVAGANPDSVTFDDPVSRSLLMIPSFNTLIDGNQALGGVCLDSAEGRNMDFWFVDNRCASVVRLTTNRNEGYIAKVRIYDHLGKFITTFNREFGRCGELQDAARITDDGRVYSFMIWNLRDFSGNAVGNGVYIWKIDYFNLTGGPSNISQDILKQGVARNKLTDTAVCSDVIKSIEQR